MFELLNKSGKDFNFPADDKTISTIDTLFSWVVEIVDKLKSTICNKILISTVNMKTHLVRVHISFEDKRNDINPTSNLCCNQLKNKGDLREHLTSIMGPTCL